MSGLAYFISLVLSSEIAMLASVLAPLSFMMFSM